MGTSYGILVLLLLVALFVFQGIAWWRIFRKAGYPGIHGLLMLIPVVSIVVLFIFAFSKWPLHRLVLVLKATSDTFPENSEFKQAIHNAGLLRDASEIEEAITEYERIAVDAQLCADSLKKSTPENQ